MRRLLADREAAGQDIEFKGDCYLREWGRVLLCVLVIFGVVVVWPKSAVAVVPYKPMLVGLVKKVSIDNAAIKPKGGFPLNNSVGIFDFQILDYLTLERRGIISRANHRVSENNLLDDIVRINRQSFGAYNPITDLLYDGGRPPIIFQAIDDFGFNRYGPVSHVGRFIKHDRRSQSVFKIVPIHDVMDNRTFGLNNRVGGVSSGDGCPFGDPYLSFPGAPKLVSGPPERESKTSNRYSSKSYKGISKIFEEFEGMPENDKHYVMGGAIFYAGLFILVAYFCAYRNP